MDRQKLLNWGGLCIGTSYLALTYDKSFAFDRPVQSAIVALALCGISIIIAAKASPIVKLSSASDQQYTAIPLEDRRNSHSGSPSTDTSDANGHASPPARSLRALRLSFLLLVTAICFRVEVARRVLKDIQCAGVNYEPFIPLILALYDSWPMRRSAVKAIDSGKLSSSTHGVIRSYFVKGRWGFIFACLLLGLGALLAAFWGSPPQSTYICAKTSSGFTTVPTLQLLGTLLDAFMCMLLARLLDSSSHARARGGGAVAVGWACILSSMLWTCIGLVVYYAVPEHRHWIVSVPRTYTWSLTKGIFVLCITINFALRIAYHVGVTATSFSLVVTCTYATSFASAWLNGHPYPPTSATAVLLSVVLIVVSAALYFIAESRREDQNHTASRSSSIRFSLWITAFVAALLIGPATFWSSRRHRVIYHPIDLLIHDARVQHETWLNQSPFETSLDLAVQSYRMRYKRNPPLNYDAWYRFANNRSSVVGDFDNIYNDILPFWSLSPAEIRQRTWEAISNPWNSIGGVSIRGGKAEISPTVPGTHRWMLDGVVRMVEKFGEWIPDMDLAFNLNDECRIAVPYEKIEPIRQAAKPAATIHDESPITRFNVDRASGWTPIPEQPLEDSSFKERSFQATFHTYGAVGCPPSSRARTQRLWNLHDHCTTCTYPHSLGQFLSNWTLSASVCHQPDMADLHGLYLSPAAFKGSHELMPVFSQSKAYGYNDILYPSAWNYMDKVTYAPTDEFPDLPLAEKRNTLFWRGVTSEGVSPGTGAWKGMARQRFIHVVNNLTTPPVVLLPRSTDSSKEELAYQSVQSFDLKELLSTDVALVDQIVRCGGRDCPDQEREFGLGERIDFQAHWGNAYLYDGDGAGFSGRFLPFLQSRSVPFKTALFREWYEGRLTAWLHFVPLDLRLHGLWSTLAYFAGVEGKVGGRDVKWERRIKEAELIAESGRDWAEKVLRKEDMEIYLFRLLLEWGRLTDDKRDELGFVG